MLATLLPVIVASAEESGRSKWWLDLNLTSQHSRDTYFYRGREHEYNPRNFGLGVTYDASSWYSVKSGWFNNSYHKTSLYALVQPHYDFLKSPNWLVALGAGAGLVTGYHNTVDDLPVVSPMGILTFSIADEHRWHATIGYLPFRVLLGRDHADVLTLQVGWKL